MTDDRKPFLMGSETEYCLSGRGPNHPLPAEVIYDRMIAVLQRTQVCLPDRAGYRGLYLEHGGRLYLDYGAHPEHATPECHTPREVALYDKAGERLLDFARERLRADHNDWQMTIVKTNLDAVDPDAVTFGTHESYTCWVRADVAAQQLIPHLVSRIVFAGAGGLTGHPHGQGFELSQRARHIQHAISSETTGNRGIYTTRVRKAADFSREGWTRAHLIVKDSHRSPFGTYLTFASTGLLYQLLNRKQTVGQGLQLEDPLRAMKEFSRDPWLRTRAKLKDGRSLTALEIQMSYQEECARAVEAGGLPDWATEAVGLWGETLAELARDPLRLADRLDPYCKLLIYGHELQRAGQSWSDLQQGLYRLMLLHAQYDLAVIRALIRDDPQGLNGEQRTQFDRARGEAGLDKPAERERVQFALRMKALELNYHELGGLYDKLRQAGRMRDVVLTDEDLERSTRQPPPGGRADARVACIREHRGTGGWECDWQYVWHGASGRCYDLRQPFTDARPLRQVVQHEPNVIERIDVLEQLAIAAGEAPPRPEVPPRTRLVRPATPA